MMSNARPLFFLIALSLFTGCVSMGRKLDQEAVNRIHEGKTTREEVVEWLGSPDQTTRVGETTTFQYHFVRASAKPEGFIPIVGAFAGGMNTQNQMVSVTFDSRGVVRQLMTSGGGSEIGFGLSAGSKAKVDVEGTKRPK
jgi:outer membrane protein assembly factor BamE (lipoprotein component of BamABCDE complex)